MVRLCLLASLLATSTLAHAQVPIEGESPEAVLPRATPAENQTRCIAQMADFPTEDPTTRYQFFKLVGDIAYGSNDQTDALLNHFGQPGVEDGTPILSAIEDIANPVLRQAAPEIIIASTDYLIDFAVTCEIYITGQTDSLTAFDPTLADLELNTAIAEDALFLRQILSDSLYSLGADQDEVWGSAANAYTRSLVTQRHAVEFNIFENDIAELENLFIDDLDGRLARSNDVINSEIDRDVLTDAISLSTEMTEAAREQAKQQRMTRLLRILGLGR